MTSAALLLEPQDYEWVELKTFVDEKAPQRKFKNNAQRRAYVEDTLKLAIEEDDEGVEGVMIKITAPNRKKVRRGKRVATSKEKEFFHDDKEALEADHTKNAKSLLVEGVTQDQIKAALDLEADSDGGVESVDADSDQSSTTSGFGFRRGGKTTTQGKARPSA